MRDKAVRPDVDVRGQRPLDTLNSDQRMMARLRNRDINAFEDLYKLQQPRLQSFLFRITRRPELVEEVINDTLMVVWNRPETFNGESRLSTWIFGIAYRKAMKALRKQDQAVDDPYADARVSQEPGPEDSFAREKTRGLLRQAIGELSAEHRAVIELTYVNELGYQEIAQIMGCPTNTVKTRMFHARRQLKRRLEGELADWLWETRHE